MPDERFHRPLFVLRNGKVVEDNVKEFLEWRKRTDPDAYQAAMNQLAETVAEAAVNRLFAEDAVQERSRAQWLAERDSGNFSARQDHTNPKPTIVPLIEIDALRAAGVLYPKTVDGWRWLYRQRAARGMAHIFLRVGRRIMIDVPAYEAALRQVPAARKR